MKASPSAAVEAERLDGLVAFARSHHLKYQVSLVDAASGTPVPIAGLADGQGRTLPVRVTVEQGAKHSPLEWELRDPAHITRLLGE